MDRNKGHPNNMDKEKNKLCGAKKKNGELCKNNRTFANGRCKFHGGASTGAKGNKNAVKHGMFEKIMFSSFSPEELELIDSSSKDTLEEIQYELAIITVREKRMLDRYAKIKDDEFTVTTIEDLHTQNGNRQTHEKKTVRENNLLFLQKFEQELNRVQNTKLKLLAQKAVLESQRHQEDGVDISKVVDAITATTATNIWTDDDEEE
jgi:uncharacterized protein YjcR